MDGRTDGLTDGRMDAWMHGFMDAWMHGCVDARMCGSVDVCMCVCASMDSWTHKALRAKHGCMKMAGISGIADSAQATANGKLGKRHHCLPRAASL